MYCGTDLYRCIFFVNTRQLVASSVSLATSFLFPKNSSRTRSAAPRFQIEPASLGFDLVGTGIQEAPAVSRCLFFGFRSLCSLHPLISMLGVGKAAPPQFILLRKTNLRRTRAAGQKAGLGGYLWL